MDNNTDDVETSRIFFDEYRETIDMISIYDPNDYIKGFSAGAVKTEYKEDKFSIVHSLA